VVKIAIAGASTLLGKELNEQLADSPLASSNFVLLDDDQAQGQLDQVGDEITFVQALTAESFERADFTFFCGTPAQALAHWIDALKAGSSVVDLTGALDAQPGVLVRSPWLTAQSVTPDLRTAAVVPADPAALALALLTERAQQAAPVRLAAATILYPASEFGRAAMDELHHQTVNLLSFQSLPREQYDAQVAFNLLGALGEEAKADLAQAAARTRRHYAALSAGRLPAIALHALHAPVFHGLAFSMLIELERPVELSLLEDAFSGERIDLVLEDTDSPSNLASTGQNEILVRLRPEPGERNPNLVSRFWIWASCDNLRLGAQNAIDCALDLGRLRPQGKVQ
jgi:aspartate-semialdehyde dehydrogenase